MTAPVDYNRVHEVADNLRGTARDLYDEIEQGDPEDTQEFVSALDEQVMLCNTCGWWCDSGDINDDGECNECEDR